jgi:hypothetical protein
MDEERTPLGLPDRPADPPFENSGLTPPEVAFERFLRDKHNRREDKYSHICARVAVENLPPGHLYRWFTEWMNRQLSDIGVNSTAGVALPPLHFELVRVNGDQSAAHTFPSEEYSFIVVTQPMFDGMLRLARLLVDGNRAFFRLQIAPEASQDTIAQLLLMMQFCFVTGHEYSHPVRQHTADAPPHAGALGESLSHGQELDADGYGIYHDLTYFFNGGGRAIASACVRLPVGVALHNSILSCFLLSLLMQYCARWAGKIQVEADLSAEHPPIPVRIDYALRCTEMWCREVGNISTSWMTDGTTGNYFAAVAALFPANLKASWDQQIAWLKTPASADYRARIGRAIDRLRTGSG